MGYQLQNRLEVSILINNVEFPLDTFNYLEMLHIGYSTRTRLPTCHFKIVDARHTLDVVNLQDGIPITISIKPLQATTTIYNFRKFNHKKYWNGECFAYEVDAYYDSPLYWAGTTVVGLQGTSSEVIQQIATKCGLSFDGVSTSDSQLWMPRNRTYAEFARSICERGYVTDGSYMMLGLDHKGVLHYKDVNNLPDPKVNLVLGQTIGGSYVVADYMPKTSSGLSNKMQGYQNTRFQQSMISSKLSESYDSVTFNPDVSSVLLNQAISQKIGSGYRSFSGIDVGNVHPSYEKAYYQNKRFAATYSLGVEFLMLTPTDLTLFDRFTFSVDTEAQKTDVSYAGTYTVAAKALYIQGASVGEKILGVRQGTNMQYTQG